MTTASWQPDPLHRHEFRWWDGQNWSAHVSDHGVASVDPVMAEAEPHVQWAAPTLSAPPPTVSTPIVTDVPAERPKKRTGLLVGGVLALVALGVGAFFVFRGDDKPGTTLGGSDPTTAPTVVPGTTAAPGTTTATTTVTSVAATTTEPEQVITLPATTVPATTVTPATIAPTTTPTTPPTTAPAVKPITAGQLVKVFPTRADVPSNWTVESGASVTTHAHDTGSICNGPNGPARAQKVGSVAEVYGPTFGLPNRGHFGMDAYSFRTTTDADAFLVATIQQAQKCGKPLKYRVPETNLDIFADPYGNDTIWNMSETATPRREVSPYVDRLVSVVNPYTANTRVNGKLYAFTSTDMMRFERHGTVVLRYYLWGDHDMQGFPNSIADAYRPTRADLVANVRLVSQGILDQLP